MGGSIRKKDALWLRRWFLACDSIKIVRIVASAWATVTATWTPSFPSTTSIVWHPSSTVVLIGYRGGRCDLWFLFGVRRRRYFLALVSNCFVRGELDRWRSGIFDWGTQWRTGICVIWNWLFSMRVNFDLCLWMFTCDRRWNFHGLSCAGRDHICCCDRNSDGIRYLTFPRINQVFF